MTIEKKPMAASKSDNDDLLTHEELLEMCDWAEDCFEFQEAIEQQERHDFKQANVDTFKDLLLSVEILVYELEEIEDELKLTAVPKQRRKQLQQAQEDLIPMIYDAGTNSFEFLKREFLLPGMSLHHQRLLRDYPLHDLAMIIGNNPNIVNWEDTVILSNNGLYGHGRASRDLENKYGPKSRKRKRRQELP